MAYIRKKSSSWSYDLIVFKMWGSQFLQKIETSNFSEMAVSIETEKCFVLYASNGVSYCA